MKKLIALCLVLTLCLMAGCATAQPEASETTPVKESAAETTPAAESDAVPEATSEPEAEPVIEAKYSLPLAEEVTLTAWAMWIPGLTSYLDSANDNLVLKELGNRLNVRLDMSLCAADSTAETEFNLLIASGDYPDLINNFKQYYTPGIDSAIDEEVLIPMNDLLNPYMPNLATLLENQDIYEDIVTANGYVAQAAQITDPEKGAYDITEGLNIRKDWLESLGLDVPETFDQLHDFLLAAKNEYDPYEPLYVGSSGIIDPLLAASGVSSGFYVSKEGEIKYGMQTQELYDYLEMMNGWFNEGIFTENYIVKHTGRPLESEMAAGYSAIWTGSDEAMNTINVIGENTGAVVTALPAPVYGSGEKISAASKTQSLVGTQGYSITTDCETPEIAALYLDYMYSEEGALLNNWGIEGETFNYDEDGLPYYTDLIANNESGIPVIFCRFMYVSVTGTFLKDPYVQYYNYCDEAKEAVSVWESAYDYYDTDNPTIEQLQGIMTSDERSEYAGISTEISTYVDEAIARFISGTTPINEASWEEFQSGIMNYDVQHIFELLENKYDEYLEIYK